MIQRMREHNQTKGSPNLDFTMESKYIYSPLFIVFFADVAL